MKTIVTADGSQVYHGRFVAGDGDSITVEVTHIFDLATRHWIPAQNTNGTQRTGTWAGHQFGSPQVVTFR